MQPIVQIVLESSLTDELTEVPVGRGNDANIHPLGPFGAERLDFSLLQDPQQFGLQPDAHRADLVEKDGAAVGQRELASLRAGSVGERPSNMAEEL